MKTFQRMAARLCLALALVVPIVPCGRVAAQEAATPEAIAASKEEKAYVTQYALIGMCVALGLVLVCKPSKRTDKVKLDEN